MHPAYSVIIFTTASGAGYGLLFWLSLAHLFGVAPEGRWLSFIAIAIALVLITIGLLSSTLHLGHPERAWRAFSQWRSSWLSREGVVAVATYVPSSLLALIWMLGVETNAVAPLAALSALGAIATVYCTSMIYACLRTVRRWNMKLVPAAYLALSAATGAALMCGLLAAVGAAPLWLGVAALVGYGVAAAVKLAYWRTADAAPELYTREMATGLGQFGDVRSLDPPHTRPNFVMREMGYAVARKHAAKLRRIVIAALFIAPILLMIGALAVPTAAALFYIAAILSTGLGVVVERWLFFAEAEHVSMLYYAAPRPAAA